MLGIVAAVCVLHLVRISAASAATSAVFAPASLMPGGLACLALHLTGVGTGWPLTRRR